MQLSLGKTNHRQVCTMLKLVYQNLNINRKFVGETLAIDRAMVTHIYNYLVEQGWLIEQESTLKRLPLVLNENKIYAAGVEIQPEFQVLVITNLRGKVLFEKRFSETVRDIVGFLKNTVGPAIEKSGLTVAGLGIAVPGIVLPTERKILRSVPFGPDAEIQLPEVLFINKEAVPLFLDNDVRCWGWGQVAFNKETEPFFVFLQHFIDSKDNPDLINRISGGSAYFANGKPCIGANSCGGELPGVFRIEEFRSIHIGEDEKETLKSNKENQEKFIKNYALIVSYLATVFDVKKVYLAGFENFDKASLIQKIEKYSSEYCLYPEFQKHEIVFENDDATKTAYGACGLVFEELIVRPCETESIDSRIFPKKA